ncbi:MAG: ribbon-helix-helix domain-containing protein [Bifidobacteriaceae bacterium]|jgi:hypothetical protein|nr:ribbon-helix-helix domain-containing protein [Bifidobacteriaceae bacterium]
MTTRNVTLSLPEDVFRQAKVLAATRDTSVSALVADALRQLVGQGDYDTVWAREVDLMRRGSGLAMGGAPMSRDEAHSR